VPDEGGGEREGRGFHAGGGDSSLLFGRRRGGGTFAGGSRGERRRVGGLKTMVGQSL